ncbi:membrane progestin receptor gamma-like [Clavelina lepadiformis]|uniref:Uncharacterized protein n=1 Tax=Clavelina lepadiformis TaxID=159417 RepID=A0ABP0F0I6_CLALP
MIKYAAAIELLASSKPGCENQNGDKRVNALQRLKLSYNRWVASYNYKCCDEVDDVLKRPFINTGYRHERASFIYYLKSILTPNNESVNVWTHFLPFLYFVYRIYNFMRSEDDPFAVLNYPYYVHGIGVCAVLLISTIAHTFCSCSAICSKSCFGADYAAIYCYGISCLIPFEFYLCPMSHNCQGPTAVNYLTFMCIFSLLATFATLFSDYSSRSPIPGFRTVTYVFGIGTVYTPCVVRYFIYSFEHTHPSYFIGHDYSLTFLLSTLCLIIAAFFYTQRLPERWYTGKFDIIGHSHNLFHMLSALAMYMQNVLLANVLEDVKQGIKDGYFSEEHFNISWQATLGAYILLLVSTNLVVGVYAIVLRKDRSKAKCK